MAASLNEVRLIGNVTRDPEVKFLPSGTAVCELGLAINSSYFDKAKNQKVESVTFVDVACFNRTAELCGEYVSRGKSILVLGRLKTEEWTDKQSGQKRSKLKVIAETVQFLGGKSDSQQSRPERETVPASGDDMDQDTPF